MDEPRALSDPQKAGEQGNYTENQQGGPHDAVRLNDKAIVRNERTGLGRLAYRGPRGKSLL